MVQFFMLVIGLLGAKGFAKISRVSDAILIPVVFSLSVVGSYAIRNSMVDVGVMFAFGVLGYLIKKFDLNPAAIVLALILGPIGEKGLRRGAAAQRRKSRDPALHPHLLGTVVPLYIWYLFTGYYEENGTAMEAKSE